MTTYRLLAFMLKGFSVGTSLKLNASLFGNGVKQLLRANFIHVSLIFFEKTYSLVHWLDRQPAYYKMLHSATSRTTRIHLLELE